MMDHDKWISAGERMGLTGTYLQAYVDKREKDYLDREERMLRRDDERQRRDDEKLRQELERQKIEDERQQRRDEETLRQELERQKLEDVRLEKAAMFKREEQEREIALLKLRAETGLLKAEPSSRSLRPKLQSLRNRKMIWTLI